MPNTIRILGIDPGLLHTGFGVIDVEGPRHRFITAGVINIPVSVLSERLRFIFTEVDKIVKETMPTFAACEKVFVNMNPSSTLALGQARGAAVTALAVNHLLVEEFNPTEIKMSVVGAGRATKSQIQAMVSRLLNIDTPLKPDAADALACALTAAQSFRMSHVIGGKKTNAGKARIRHNSEVKNRGAWETFLGAKIK